MVDSVVVDSVEGDSEVEDSAEVGSVEGELKIIMYLFVENTLHVKYLCLCVFVCYCVRKVHLRFKNVLIKIEIILISLYKIYFTSLFI